MRGGDDDHVKVENRGDHHDLIMMVLTVLMVVMVVIMVMNKMMVSLW